MLTRGGDCAVHYNEILLMHKYNQFGGLSCTRGENYRVIRVRRLRDRRLADLAIAAHEALLERGPRAQAPGYRIHPPGTKYVP